MANFIKPITKIEEAASSGTTWFFRSGYMNAVGEKLFSNYQNDSSFYTLDDSSGEKVLLNTSGYKLTASWDSSASGNFVFGCYESTLSRGSREKYFAFFHKLTSFSGTTKSRTLTLRFERGFNDNNANPKPLILKLTLNSGTTYSSGNSADNGYIPFFAFESTASGSGIGKKRLGWIYTYIPSSTSSNANITSGVRTNLYNLRTKVQFTTTPGDDNQVPTNNIPIVIADMNNPSKDDTSYKQNPNNFNTTYSESCYIPSSINTIYVGCEKHPDVNPALNSMVCTLGYVGAQSNSLEAVNNGVSYTHFFGSPDSDGFNRSWSTTADSSITYIDGQNPWPGWPPTYNYNTIGSIQELSCGVAFLTPLGTDFYVAGSMGVSQLFPAFSTSFIKVIIHKYNGTQLTSEQYVNSYFVNDFDGDWPTTDTRANYDFSGWYVHYGTNSQTKITGTTKVLQQYVDSNNEVHVYSHFTPHTYRITYDSKGGTSVSSQTYTVESSFSLANSPTKTAYTFSKWKVKTSVGSWTAGDLFSAGKSFSAGQYGDVTLEAQWSPTTYYIYYDYTNGEEYPSGQDYHARRGYNIETSSLTLRAAPTEKVGHQFSKWKVKATSGSWTVNTTYDAGYTFTEPQYGDVYLVAQWTKRSYTLTTQLDSSSTGMGSVSGGGTKQYDASCTITASPETGYEFVNWTFTGAKTGTSTSASVTFNMPAGNVTATAKFKARTFTLTFNLNTANCPPGLSNPSTLNVTYNGTYPTLDTEHNNPAWDSAHDTGEWDYEFDDWYLGNSSTKYVAGQTYTTVGNQTWNAKWTKTHQRYTVVWKDYDDSIIETDENVEYGTTPTYDGPTLNRPGYTWAGRTVGWTPVVSSVTGNATYKAVYQIITYTISYTNLHGATHSNPTEYKITTSTFTLSNPTSINNYKFVEWRLQDEGDGDVKDVEVGAKIEQIKKGSYGNIKIKAIWVPKLHSFEAKPGHSAEENDYFGIPLDALTSGFRYVLEMYVVGDRKNNPWKYTPAYVNGNRYTTYPSLDPDPDRTSVRSFIDPTESSGNGRWHCNISKLSSAGLTNILTGDSNRTENNCLFPMDVWRCRIHSDNGTLHVRLTTYENSDATETLGYDEITSTFVIDKDIRPRIKNGILHEGVVNIRNLNLGNNTDTTDPEDYTTSRFIGNKKSTVLINVVSTHKKNGKELLYEAVPMHFRFQLYYPGTDRPDANWESETVTRDVPEDQILEYTQNYNMNYDYVAGDIFVADNPFPKLEADLLNAKLRYKILDSRHNFS